MIRLRRGAIVKNWQWRPKTVKGENGTGRLGFCGGAMVGKRLVKRLGRHTD